MKNMKRVFLFGNASGKASVIVRIAVMAAVTLIVQWLVGLSKIQLLTGSFVNMCLLIAAMTTGIVGRNLCRYCHALYRAGAWTQSQRASRALYRRFKRRLRRDIRSRRLAVEGGFGQYKEILVQFACVCGGDCACGGA